MSSWLDLKYLKMLPLEGFTGAGNNIYNFRCPICGDSQKNARKKRGYGYAFPDGIQIKCYNCGYTKPFWVFLRDNYPVLYSEYRLENLKDNGFNVSSQKTTSEDLFATEYDQLDLQMISDLPTSHSAVKYLLSRKIPRKDHNRFYYTDTYAKWSYEKTGAGSGEVDMYDPRIVIPYYTKHKKIFTTQGRTLINAKPKYMTTKFDLSHPKIYGLDMLDQTQETLIVEGPIDSYYLPNALAVSGSLGELSKVLQYVTKDQCVVVPDNEPRSRITTKFIHSAIEQGYKTVLWPSNFPFKDIGSAVEFGMTKEDICSIIKQSIAYGLSGLAKFSFWKKC